MEFQTYALMLSRRFFVEPKHIKVNLVASLYADVMVFLKKKPWGENLIILVICFTYPVYPFIARSGVSQLREFP